MFTIKRILALVCLAYLPLLLSAQDTSRVNKIRIQWLNTVNKSNILLRKYADKIDSTETSLLSSKYKKLADAYANNIALSYKKNDISSFTYKNLVDEMEFTEMSIASAYKKGKPSEVKFAISELTYDLSLKLDAQSIWAQPSTASIPTTPNFVLVTVKVISSKNQQELINYEVFASPKYAPEQKVVFNPTKNATKSISPGIKTFWIEKNGKLIARRESVTLSYWKPVDEVIFIVDPDL